LRDGIADVHHLGLAAMEVQFIKVNPLQHVALEEEVGHRPRELVQQLVIAVGPNTLAKAEPMISSLTSAIKRRETLTTITTSLAKEYSDLQTTKALARSLDVELTVHAPYYVDFFGSPEARERSKRQVQWAGVLAEGLGARMTVTHLGFYGEGPHENSVDTMIGIVGELSRWLTTYTHGMTHLAIEPSGHPDVFGSREEVLEIVRRVRGVVPVLNVPHIAARERRPLETPEEIRPLVEQFRAASGGTLYLNFSGVEFFGPGEMRLTPVKRGHVRFDPLAEVLVERDYNATVISSSPLLEHDAMYMKLLYERALTRRWVKRHPPALASKAGAAKKPSGPSHPPSHAAARVRPAHPKASGGRPAPARRRAPSKAKAHPRPRPPERRARTHGRRR
jgi:deoxyribonuclease-4